MPGLKTLVMLAALVSLAAGGRAGADDIKFTFHIPAIPDPPVINSVVNSTALIDTPIRVYATIEGTEQKETCCTVTGKCESQCSPADQPNTCDWEDCRVTDFYASPDPRVVPNPTCIPNAIDTSGGISPAVCGGKTGNPMLFYYYRGNPAETSSIDMTYNKDSGIFEASIPTTGLFTEDTVTYYIVASDNMGNVVAQAPDTTTAPCTILTSWQTYLQTPSIDNCSFMNSYERCGAFMTGKPSCSSNFSQNDPADDTCGESGTVDPALDINDILGISGGTGAGGGLNDAVCARIQLQTNPPDVGSSSGPIDIYLLTLYNPDIIDPNPNDTYITNSFAITFAPEASGADPNLVRVLWNGECITNPNTADPLSCKLLVGGSGSTVPELQIGAGNNTLTFITKNLLPNGKSVIGASSIARTSISTGNIQLNGGTPYWLTDATAGFAIMKKNQEVTIADCGAPSPPPNLTAVCANSAGASSPICANASPPSTSNECRLTIPKSPDCAFTDQYRIYHGATSNLSSAVLLAEIPSNRDCQDKEYTHTIASLDGKTHYYWVPSVSVSECGGLETPRSAWVSTRCTVEDVTAPADPPLNFSCATPEGTENKCQCSWTADTVSDPSIRGFNLWRGDTLLKGSNSLPAVAGVTDYSYTDESPELITGQTYNYKVNMVDAGGNQSAYAESACFAEDLKPPDRVDPLLISIPPGTWTEVKLQWKGGTEPDLAGYNVYKCENVTNGESCVDPESYTKSNTALIPHVGGGNFTQTDTSFTIPDKEWCFWVEACDNCNTAGTCPGNGGSPNCSRFDTMKSSMKCVIIPSISCDGEAPLFPENLKIEAPPEGGRCELEWDPVCKDESGPIPYCNLIPDPYMLNGYYIVRVKTPTFFETGAACNDVSMPTNPAYLPDCYTNPDECLAGTVGITIGNPGFTDYSVVNGNTYCYLVFSRDMSNFSRNYPPPDPVACSPSDTLPPEPPDIASISYNGDTFTCTVTWNRIAEDANDGKITYSLYSCEGDISTFCATADAYYGITLPDPTAITFADSEKDEDTQYSYCVTAFDGTNEGAILSGASVSASLNCGVCITSMPPYPPTGVTAEPAAGYGNFTVAWTPPAGGEISPDTYNIYICKAASSAPALDANCVRALSGAVSSPREINVSDIAPAYGSYYVVVTALSHGGAESAGAASSGTISITTCDDACGDGSCDSAAPCNETAASCPADCNPVCQKYKDKTSCDNDPQCLWQFYPGSCNPRGYCGDGICQEDECTGYYSDYCEPDCYPQCMIDPCSIFSDYHTEGSVKGKFTSKSAVPCSTGPDCPTGRYKIVEKPLEDVTLKVLGIDDAGYEYYLEHSNEYGAISWFDLCYFRPGKKYEIVAEYKGKLYTPAMKPMCANAASADSDGYCDIKLMETYLETNVPIVVNAISIPDFNNGGGGALVGDITGDGKINFPDLRALKNAFNTKAGERCYKFWADADLDGSIDMADLSILKSNFNRKFADPADGYDPLIKIGNDDYNQDSDPSNDCCRTANCH